MQEQQGQPAQPERKGMLGELVPLGRRVALDLPETQEVVVLRGTKVLLAVPGRRGRREARAVSEALDQLAQQGVKVTRVPLGARDLLAMGALRALPARKVPPRPSPDQPDPQEPLDLQDRTVQLLGPQVLPEPRALPEPQALPDPQALPLPSQDLQDRLAQAQRALLAQQVPAALPEPQDLPGQPGLPEPQAL